MSTHGSSLPHVRPERTGGTGFVTSAMLRRALESGPLTVDGTIAVVTAHRPDAAARADALLRGERAPHGLHWF
ncbi:hypothetical protein ACFCWY_23725 [Streptomyces sp. NPDC056362]|uniref:hypothetical protein n=1 Tax=unclassified Streptomyces TaxID=2593676 RepID=UPI0035DB209B